MGLRFVMLDGAARSLVQRLIEAGDAAPEIPTAPGFAPPAVEFEHGSVRVRLTAATASFFTYNPLLHVGIGGCFLPAETDVPLGTGYQMDILDGEDRLLVRCKAKVAAKQDRWIGVRFLEIERSALQALRAEIAKLASARDRVGPFDAGRASRTWCSGRWRDGRARRGARGHHPAVTAAAGRHGRRRDRGRVRRARRPRRPRPRRRFRRWVVVGLKPGPRVSVVGALRGHETTAALAAARLAAGLDPAALMGSVVIVPVLRPAGRLSRTGRPGRAWRFPGDAAGKRAARDAFALFSDIVVGASALVVLGVPGRGRRGAVVVRRTAERSPRAAPRPRQRRRGDVRGAGEIARAACGGGRRQHPGRPAVRRR